MTDKIQVFVKQSELQEIALIERQPLDAALIDDGAQLRRFGGDQRFGGADCHLSVLAFDRQVEIDPDLLINIQLNRRTRGFGELGGLAIYFV